MKIQCSCGSKYVIEVTPDMARQPVHFVCGTCGRDASEFVTSLVRQELGITAPVAAPAFTPPPPGASMIAPPPPGATLVKPTAPVGAPRPVATIGTPPPAVAVPPPPGPGPLPSGPAPVIGTPLTPVGVPRPVASIVGAPPPPPSASFEAPPPPPPATPRPGLHIHKATAAAAPVAAEAETSGPVKCLKHGADTTDKCYVCSKPICPHCMALFGYVCSPLCRAKAESHGIKVPVYAGQKDVVEAKLWGKVVRLTLSVVGGTALILGVWFWYAWFGQTPKPILAIRFEKDPAYSGKSAFAGPAKDQIVYLHGGTLARYDMKQKKEIWSHYIIDKKQIEADVQKEMRETQKAIDAANFRGSEHVPKMPDPAKLARSMEKYEAASMDLRVNGQNVWILKPGKLIRYDWDKGELAKEIEIKERYDRRLNRGDELVFLQDDLENKKRSALRVNLNTCESVAEDLTGAPKKELAMNSGDGTRLGSKDQGTSGLPTAPGKDNGKPIDPKKVQQQVQHMSLPSKIALPATLGSTMNQDRALNELDDGDPMPRGRFGRKKNEEVFTLIPTKDGFMQFNVKLLEEKIVTRVAMKAQPPVKTGGSKATLENVSVANQYDVINDMVNQAQRDRGGDKIEEDESRYQVKIKKPDGSDEWVGEVIGAPGVFPLQTVTVVSGAKMLIVLDKNNKKMWQTTNTYPVESSWRDPDEEDPHYGQGPCVERKDTLYVFDQGVLTSFDLANSNVHWRLPSVGISGLHFDDKGMIYVNTTDAGPESIKYSRQIDITTRISDVVLKVDPKTGKTLWRAKPGGMVNYVSGPYIYTVQSYDTHDDDDEDASPYTVTTGFEAKPYLRIRRINPKNGKEMWEHFQERAPLDVQFDGNRIHLVFRKEVQVLKFLAL